jgi:pimeloyl-ACP methyl ester carboxylesterase
MNMVADTSVVAVNGANVEVIERGRGTPLVFLHPEIGIDRNAPVIEHLARAARVIAPSHPGFGRSELPPKGITTVDDLSYFYLDFLEALDLTEVTLVGVALGGWIAAEIAVKSTARIARLVLANPVGIKVSDRATARPATSSTSSPSPTRNSAHSPITIRTPAGATTNPCPISRR